MTKKQVTVQVGNNPKISQYYGSGGEYLDYGYGRRLRPDSTISELQEQLSELYAEFAAEYSELHFQRMDDCGCRDHMCGCAPSYVLYGTREETDLEYKFRTKREADQKADREKRERAELAALKAKYG